MRGVQGIRPCFLLLVSRTDHRAHLRRQRRLVLHLQVGPAPHAAVVHDHPRQTGHLRHVHQPVFHVIGRHFQFVALVQLPAPLALPMGVPCVHRVKGVALIRCGVPLPAVQIRHPHRHHHVIRQRGFEVGPQVHLPQPSVVVGVEVTRVTLLADRQAKAGRLVAHPDPGAPISDTVVTGAHGQLTAHRIGAVASDDVDDAEHGIGTIGRRVRTAQHLDALDVFQHHVHHAAVRVAQIAGGVHRAAVDQDQVAGAIVVDRNVVRRQRVGPVPAPCQVTRNQAHHLDQRACARQANRVPIDHGDGTWRLVERLIQPTGRQHHGHVGKVVLFGGHALGRLRAHPREPAQGQAQHEAVTRLPNTQRRQRRHLTPIHQTSAIMSLATMSHQAGWREQLLTFPAAGSGNPDARAGSSAAGQRTADPLPQTVR